VLLGRVDVRCLIFIERATSFRFEAARRRLQGRRGSSPPVPLLDSQRSGRSILSVDVGGFCRTRHGSRKNQCRRRLSNDLHIEKLEVPYEIADEFLQALAALYGMTLGPDVRNRVLERVGSDRPIPYYLQLIFDQLRQKGGEPVIGDVGGPQLKAC